MSAPSHDNFGLPPARALRWSSLLAFWLLLTVVWLLGLRFAPATLLGPPSADATVTAMRAAIVTVVSVVLVTLVIYANWRRRLERLAFEPGPLLVYPIEDRSGGAVTQDGSNGESTRTESIRALLQRRLLGTQLQGSTAIPLGGGSSDFLQVVESAGGKIEGFWGALLRLTHFLAPVSSYEVRCSLLDPDIVRTTHPCVLQVELTRLPHVTVANLIFAETWSSAADQASDWLVATVLPHTRRCAIPPWTQCRNLQIEVKQFEAYQRFREYRDKAGQMTTALRALDEALEYDPTNLALRLDKGKLQEQMCQYLPALQTYEEIIAQAARRDRRLAYLRFDPPPRDQAQPPITDPRWHDVRRAPGLHPRHPVIYTARYRYALLLSLGPELAQQWCAAQYAGDRRYDPLRRRFAETYREPADRLHEQVPAIAARHPAGEALIESILTLDPNTHADTIAPLIALFFTSMGVWEVEHLIIERTGDRTALRYRRDHREIIPDESLRLLLPRAILRRALAIHEFDSTCALRIAESSMIYPIDEPVVEPQLRKLLETGWPRNGTQLGNFIRTVTGRRHGGSLRTWHVHYNAACNLATLLKGPGWDKTSREHREVVRAIVTELEKSAACGGLGYSASKGAWVGKQDPDLDEVRNEVEFEEFRKRYL